LYRQLSVSSVDRLRNGHFQPSEKPSKRLPRKPYSLASESPFIVMPWVSDRGYATLTPRKREVLALLVRGLLNKQAGFELGITEYTVQIHRAHIMRKMEADSFATLVKLTAKFVPCA
jgi:DNA-binding NarL/FixJ family response regulator